MNTKNANAEEVWRKLQNLLARRSHSETELKQKLAKSFDTEEVKKAIERAKQNKWLEKPEEIALKITEEFNRKKKGWLYIKYALKKRGLPFLTKNTKTEEEKIFYWLSKKSLSENLPKKEEVSLYRFLTNRGFESRDIKEALQHYKSRSRP